MAMERYGLGALITADEKPFVQGTERARDALAQFSRAADSASSPINRMNQTMSRASETMRRGAQQISEGVGQLATGLKNAALGAVPLTVAIGAGAKKAAEFEKQMSAVGSITRANEEDMAALTAEAKRMGIESVFTATQAGEGMEYLARAGADSTQIIQALQGTMSAAAADSIDLATAADIVSQVIKGMGLEWEDAGHAADVLALTSARSNTNIISLGESFKYGVTSARQLGISLEETSAIFGKLADSGLRGSIAGTSFTNMINKMTKPSETAQAALNKWGISLDNADGSFRKISSIIADVTEKINEIPSASERAAITTELFGLRGAKAYGALAASGKEALDDLEAQLLLSSAGIGAATEMAEVRLDNFIGKLTLFGSSVESISIGIFSPLLKNFTPVIESVTEGLNNVLFSLEGLNEIKARENQEHAKSAQLIAKETTSLLSAAGATGQYSSATAGAVQILAKMQLGEETLTSTQVSSRKRAIAAAIEASNIQRTEAIKTAQIEAAGVENYEQLSEARKAIVANQIKASTDARRSETQKMIDLAFKGVNGSAEAQKWLRQQIVSEALAGSKKLSEVEKKAVENEIMQMMELEAAASKRGDAIRAQIFSVEKLQEIENKYGSTAVQIALGLQDAIGTLKEAWNSLIEKVKEVGRWLEDKLGADGVRKIAKYATIFAIVAASIVPVILGLTAFGFMISGLTKGIAAFRTIGLGAVTAIRGALMSLATTFWPLTLVLGAIGMAFLFIRKEGETTGQTLSRVWNSIKAGISHVYNNVILPITDGFRKRWDQLVGGVIEKWSNMWTSVVSKVTGFVNKIKEKFSAIFSSWATGVGDIRINWENVGAAIANVISSVAGFVADVIGGIVDLFVWVGETIWSIIEGPLEAFKSAIDTIAYYWEPIKNSFVDLWITVTEVLSEVKTEITGLIDEIKGLFAEVSDAIGISWGEVGSFLGTVVSGLLQTIAQTIKYIFKAVGKVISTVVRIIKTVVGGIKSAFENVFGGILQIMEGDFLGGIKRIGVAIFNAITLPIRAILGALIKLIRQIPYAEQGAKLLGIDLESIQKWMDEGMTYEGEISKKEKRDKTIAAAQKGTEKMEKKTKEVTKETAAVTGGEEDRLARLRQRLETVGDLKAREKRKMMQAPTVENNVTIDDKRMLDIKNSMCVSGEDLNVASARHKQEIQDRSGFKATPWQRRAMLEHGAAPMKGVG